MKKLSISFIVPAYNDASTIEAVIKDIETASKTARADFDITIANDASPDGLFDVLASLQKRRKFLSVITHTKNLGYGATIRELYYAAKRPWIMSLPGDRQVRADVLLNLLPHLKDADMIIGWRKSRSDDPKRKFQSWVYNMLLRILFSYHIHDANSVRLMKKRVIDDLALTSRSAFVDAELGIKAKVKGFRVIEVPISHFSRTKGTGGGSKWSIIWPTIADMVKFFVNQLPLFSSVSKRRIHNNRNSQKPDSTN